MTQKIQKILSFEAFSSPTELNSNDFKLYQKAKEISKNAYAPYSNFRVGCALELSSGEIVLANNQENIAYPSGLCAERVALFYAGANFPNDEVLTIFIYAEGNLLPENNFLTPCGSCRQVMAESQHRQKQSFRILLCGNDKQVLMVEKMEDLLPFSFGMID